MQAELEAYLSKPASDKSIDQLNWWSVCAATYPVGLLSAATHCILFIMLTIVP